MTAQVVIGILLGIAVLIVAVCSLGVLTMDNPYDRLHFVTPISSVAAIVVAVAVTIREGLDQNTAATWLAVLLVVISSPLLSHATIRAARIRQEGDWKGGRRRAQDHPQQQ